MLKKTASMMICIVMPLMTIGSSYLSMISLSDSVALPSKTVCDEPASQIISESTADIESSENYQKSNEKAAEGIPKEAVIDQGKIDVSALDMVTYDILHKELSNKYYQRTDKIIFGDPEGYSDMKGITCFRGNHHRNASSYGIAQIKEKKLEKIWEKSIGKVDGWTGVGWNGQPAIVEWAESVRISMNLYEEKRNKAGLKEVIYGTLDSNIYFLDLDDGKETREKIKVPGPIKGSVTVDPRGLPLLYAGQGINVVHGKKVEMGYRIFNLINQEKLYFINGTDSFAYRGWPAFDSTALIDTEKDTMILAGENGIFYTAKLNTSYDTEKNTISIEPEVTKYHYKIRGNSYQGIENSVAVYKNLAFFGDNGGWLQCIDLNTLKPVWVRNVTDDTDSTIAIDEEEADKVFLYTACEVDKQGVKGKSFIRKIDALSGELIWEKPYLCDSKLGDHPSNGGALATPVIGKQSISNMVIYNLSRCGGFNKGRLAALDKRTGEELWHIELKNYSWSSPVDIYDEEGYAYILLCDSAGNMHLIEGLTGEILDTISLGANVEGSPAVFEDMAVVGTRGQKIVGIKIK